MAKTPGYSSKTPAERKKLRSTYAVRKLKSDLEDKGYSKARVDKAVTRYKATQASVRTKLKSKK